MACGSRRLRRAARPGSVSPNSSARNSGSSVIGRVHIITCVLNSNPMREIVVLALAAATCSAQRLGIDTHIDTPQRVLIEGVDITKRLPDGQADLPRLREGGMNAPFFALWVPTFFKGAEAVRRTLDLRDAMQALFDKHPDQIELALTAADIVRITKRKKIAAVLSMEGGHQIDDDLAVLRMY